MIIGITGKSGSGKSTLAKKILEKKENAVYLEIDKIGHKVLTFPDVEEEIVKTFGKDVINEDKVDRKKLGDIVFNSREEWNKLNKISWEYMKVEIDNLIEENKDKVIIIDWLLLPLSHYFDMCDIKILLDIPYNIRKERAMKRDNITEEAFDLREKASIDFDKDKFDYVLETDEKIKRMVKTL
ncbi:MAG: dephospho-CoA kinase [Bacilli bacterium]|nr:dephospho-CoA kinase [Bacilli bacterium]